MHAVHDQYLRNGFKNELLRNFFSRACSVFVSQKSDGKAEYFLSNEKEFFAVTSSIYLFGDIPRPPYNMKTISDAMLRYAIYLKQLFSGHEPESIPPLPRAR